VAPSLDETDLEVIEGLSAFLAKEAPLSHNLQAARSPDGYDPTLLQRLGAIGFFGITGPGEDAPVLSTAVIGALCQESGRVLLGGPWLEQLLAARLLERAGDRPFVDAVTSARTLVSLPLAGDAWLRPPAAEVELDRARLVDGCCQIGFAQAVDAWLVPARDLAKPRLVLVRLRPDSCRARRTRAWSDLWHGSEVGFSDAEGTVVAEIASKVVNEHLLDSARLLACTAVGSTEALLASTTDHLKQRQQFGRHLGAFQALQHLMADVFIELEHTRSLVRATLRPLPIDEFARYVAMAKIASDGLALRSAERALQAHGGLGFTWELPVHHYLKEALRRRTLPQPTELYRRELRSCL
jgi:alkylation response protein AidB-like acyl-CoA dehydrogenase